MCDCFLGRKDTDWCKRALDYVVILRKQNILKNQILIAARKNIISLKSNSRRKATWEKPRAAIELAFSIPRHFSILTKEEEAILGKYFYGCGFLIQCKEAALSVSGDVWENIVKTLLVE
jgi:hypothetical protein